MKRNLDIIIIINDRKQFNGTTLAYCKSIGISRTTYYQYKNLIDSNNAAIVNDDSFINNDKDIDNTSNKYISYEEVRIIDDDNNCVSFKLNGVDIQINNNELDKIIKSILKVS